MLRDFCHIVVTPNTVNLGGMLYSKYTQAEWEVSSTDKASGLSTHINLLYAMKGIKFEGDPLRS
jgi:hypothetical protein